MNTMSTDVGVLSGAIVTGIVSQAVGLTEAILGIAGLQALGTLFFAVRTKPSRTKKRLELERRQGKDKHD